jgi:hypothetical protein
MVFWSTLQHSRKEFDALKRGQLVYVKISDFSQCYVKSRSETELIYVMYVNKVYKLSIPRTVCSEGHVDGSIIQARYSQRFDYMAHPEKRMVRFQAIVSFVGLIFATFFLVRKVPMILRDVRQLSLLLFGLLFILLIPRISVHAQTHELEYTPPDGFFHTMTDRQRGQIFYSDKNGSKILLHLVPNISSFSQGKFRVAMSFRVINKLLRKLELGHKDIIELESGSFFFLIYVFESNNQEYCVYNYNKFFDNRLICFSFMCKLQYAENYKNEFLNSLNSLIIQEIKQQE